MPEANSAVTGSPDSMRAFARELFEHALSVADIRNAFERHVSCERGVLRIGEDLYDLGCYERVFVAAIGKAAHTMAESLAKTTGNGFLQGIVVAPVEVSPQLPGFRYFKGGHPIPDVESLKAGKALLRALGSLNERSLVIYMISGGASAMCEQPISEDIALEDVVSTYRVLVHSGAPIAEINAIRKHLSALKGGRAAQAASAATQVAILVSDVPEGKLDSLASGPTMPDSTTVNDCYRVAERYGMARQFPPPVRALFEGHGLEETPKSGDAAFENVRHWLISSNETVVEAAAAKARAAGFAVVVDNECDDWDYADAGDHLLNRLHTLAQTSKRSCVVSGGEVTVQVTNGGVGGRNQQFALYCAEKIAAENICILSAGTDGIDGNSNAAGAVVDGTTVGRALTAGLNPSEALARFDACPLFKRLGDAIVTGPTGNNVRDLRVLLAW